MEEPHIGTFPNQRHADHAAPAADPQAVPRPGLPPRTADNSCPVNLRISYLLWIKPRIANRQAHITSCSSEIRLNQRCGRPLHEGMAGWDGSIRCRAEAYRSETNASMGSTNGKRWKSVSRVQMRRTSCSRIRTGVSAQGSRSSGGRGAFPRPLGSPTKLCVVVRRQRKRHLVRDPGPRGIPGRDSRHSGRTGSIHPRVQRLGCIRLPDVRPRADGLFVTISYYSACEAERVTVKRWGSTTKPF